MRCTTRSSAPEPAGPPWHQWCRLCAKDDSSSNVSIFCKSEHNVIDTSLATAIGKYFWVNIKIDDRSSKTLCAECYTLVSSLVSFTERVNKVQAMFSVLENLGDNSEMDPNVVRVQYGLLDEERDHIIKEKRADELIEEMNIKVLNDSTISVHDDLTDDEEPEEHIEEHIEHHITDDPEEGDGEGDGDGDGDGDVGGDAIIVIEDREHSDRLDFINKEATCCNRDKVQQQRVLKVKNRTKLFLAEEENSLLKGEDAAELKFKEEEGNEDHCNRTKISPPDESPENLKGSEQREVPKMSSNVTRKRRTAHKDGNSNGKKRKHDSDSDGSIDYRYECKICKRKYKNPTSYRKHMTEMHAVQPDIPDFVCDKCNKIVPTEKQLAMHIRTHLPLEKKLDIPCPFCEKKFTKISVMKQHVRGIHHNEKPYICDECGRGLKTLAALNEHKLVHTSDCPFECNVCKKRFKNNARLKVHLDTHTETNYVCNVCGMVLNTRRTLKMHMLVHSDNKKYKCDFCGSEFKRCKALKNHLILHTGMRPYKCNFCDKTFSNGSNCRSHKKKTHPKELAEEERQGKKAVPISIPKLEELRTCSNVVENPRKVSRSTDGLSPHMRALLIAAEERAKRGAGRGQNNVQQDDGGVDIDTEAQEVREHETIEYQNCEIEVEDVEIEEIEDEEDDEEETVIYEIIDEI